MKKAGIFLFASLLTACTLTRPVAIDDATLEEMISWSGSDFENTTVLDVQKALSKVFLLSQGEWYYIAPTRNTMRVELSYTWHYLLGYIKHMTFIDYTFTQGENNTVHADSIYNDKFTFDLLLMADWQPEGPMHNHALNDLIFKRANYFLGKTDKWYSCPEYEQYMQENNITGTIDPLCRFYRDIRPDSPEGQEILKDIRVQ